jgi:hypothetical protein
MKKLTEQEKNQVYQLFIGKVSEEIGFDRTYELLKEAKKTILNL